MNSASWAFFWAKMMGEQRAEQQFGTFLGGAAEDCMCAMPTSAAHWPCFLGTVDHCYSLVIEIKSCQRGSMCFLQ